MAHFLVDEDLPRSLAQALTRAGHPSRHVYDVGLSAHPDNEIFEYAVSKRLVIITRDVGYSRSLGYLFQDRAAAAPIV